jgi:polyisoprenyl-phosphate glycosyltransferase
VGLAGEHVLAGARAGELMRAARFSVVIPVFQNQPNLPDTIPRLLQLREALPRHEVELVFVDDGSTDGSLELLLRAQARDGADIRIVKLTRNFGQTPAIQAGLRYATGDCVGIISADLQEPCELFVDMVRAWERGAKYVIAERTERSEGRWHRAVSSIYWRLVQRFAFPDFPPLGYDFCVLDRQLVDAINGINEKNSSIFLLIYWLGYRPERLPMTRALRAKGRSQWSLLRKVGFTIDTLIAFTHLPARLITVFGLTMALACLAYLLVLLAQWALYQSAPPGWMTVVGLLSLIGSMILFSMGIVSEYLLRILDESRKRQPYVVDAVHEPVRRQAEQRAAGESASARR